jgi:hypothetical protein
MTDTRITDPKLSSAIARQRGEEPPREPDATTGAAPMTDASMAMADGGPDDLPRTFRRERDAQREAREREARERTAAEMAYAPLPEPSFSHSHEPSMPAFEPPYQAQVPSGVVTALEIPFRRLVTFFLKAVFAALPAILLLSAILWVFGQFLSAYFPWLLKMKILITFPN